MTPETPLFRSATKPEGKRAQRAETRRAELLTKAAEVLRVRGFRVATMTEIAEAAGTSKIVLYRYFGSKDDLIAVLLREVADHLLMLDAQPDVDWRQRHVDILAFSRTHPDPVVLLLRHAPQDPETRPIWRLYRRQVVERTAQRLAAIPGGESQGHDIEFYSETLTHFIFDAIARHVERTDPDADADFVDWLNRSVVALSTSWLRAPNSTDAQPGDAKKS